MTRTIGTGARTVERFANRIEFVQHNPARQTVAYLMHPTTAEIEHCEAEWVSRSVWPLAATGGAYRGSLHGLTLAAALERAVQESRDADGNGFYVVESFETHPNAHIGYRYYDVVPTFVDMTKRRFVVVAEVHAHNTNGVLITEDRERYEGCLDPTGSKQEPAESAPDAFEVLARLVAWQEAVSAAEVEPMANIVEAARRVLA